MAFRPNFILHTETQLINVLLASTQMGQQLFTRFHVFYIPFLTPKLAKLCYNSNSLGLSLLFQK